MERERIELHEFEIERVRYASIVRRESLRRYRSVFVAIVVVYCGMLAKLAWDAESALEFAISCVLLLAFLAAWIWFALSWYPAYMARSPMNRFIFGPYRIALEGSCLEVTKQGGTPTILPLDQVVRVSGHSDHLLLYVSLGSALFIPRAAFKSRDDERAFEAALAAAVKPT